MIDFGGGGSKERSLFDLAQATPLGSDPQRHAKLMGGKRCRGCIFTKSAFVRSARDYCCRERRQNRQPGKTRWCRAPAIGTTAWFRHTRSRSRD